MVLGDSLWSYNIKVLGASFRFPRYFYSKIFLLNLGSLFWYSFIKSKTGFWGLNSFICILHLKNLENGTNCKQQQFEEVRTEFDLFEFTRRDQPQLIAAITAALGNKPNLNVTVEGVSALDTQKTEMLICVQERSATGNISFLNNSSKSSFWKIFWDSFQRLHNFFKDFRHYQEFSF